MKIKNIDFKKIDEKYVVYEIFNIIVDDSNIKELEFNTRISKGIRVLSEMKVVYASGREKTYTVLNIPKKYNQLFEKYLKNYIPTA